MTPAQLDLARQLAALPGFRWGAGMLARDPAHDYRSVRVLGAADWAHSEGVMRPTRTGFTVDYQMRQGGPPPLPSRAWLPDLTDDATGGVLLGWLAGMKLRPTAGRHSDGRWDVGLDFDSTWPTGTTLAEACARALVAVGRCA